jgi:hypothetical protein
VGVGRPKFQNSETEGQKKKIKSRRSKAEDQKQKIKSLFREDDTFQIFFRRSKIFFSEHRDFWGENKL